MRRPRWCPDDGRGSRRRSRSSRTANHITNAIHDPNSSFGDHPEHQRRQQQPADRDRRWPRSRACRARPSDRLQRLDVDTRRRRDRDRSRRRSRPRRTSPGSEVVRRGGRRRRSRAPHGGCGRRRECRPAPDGVVPISASRRVAVMSSCSSRSSASRSPIEPGVDRPVEVGGVRAVLAAVGEEPAPVELRLLDEVQQLVVVGLGLARVADDEVAPERGVGLAVADVGDAVEEALPVAPAAHPAQQRLAHVLQRQVEVRHARVADRVDRGRRSDRSGTGTAAGHGRRRRRPPCTSGTIEPAPSSSGRSLPYEARSWATSTISRASSCVDLGEDRGDVAAALRAAEPRDRAEPARAVAALGDLHVGPRHRRLRARQVEQVELGQRRRRHRDQLALRPFGTSVPSRSTGTTLKALPNPATWSTSGSAAASSSP